jgi:plastocyanin
MLKNLAFVICAAVAGLGLAACGGSNSSSSTSSTASNPPATSPPAATSSVPSTSGGKSGGAPAVAADPSGQLKFTSSSLTAKAGKVTVQFTNDASLSHNLTIQQGTSGPTVGAIPTFQGGTKRLTVNLKPGTYTFFCSVPGHRDAGMQGTLTVG